MTTIHSAGDLGFRIADLEGASKGRLQSPQGYVAFVKGAPDIVLQYCDDIALDDRVVPLTPELRRAKSCAPTASMARQALRVLGVACRPSRRCLKSRLPDAVERNLTFLGLLGMIDPARPEVKVAVAMAKQAGLKSVMVTGDYKDTAEAIAARNRHAVHGRPGADRR